MGYLWRKGATQFMAKQLGEEVGDTMDYRIRFKVKVGPKTRTAAVTEGILTCLIQDDPGLDGVDAILFDEFHERHLAASLGAGCATASCGSVM